MKISNERKNGVENFDLAKLDLAIKYVERIADGCNPVNNVPLGNDDILNEPNIIRCMYFIKKVLEEVRRNNGSVGGKSRKKESMPFPVEIFDEFQYREDQSITHVLKQIFEPVKDLNVKKVSVVKITALLKDEGYLTDELEAKTGKARKVPTEKGKELGIYVMEREYNGRVYQTVIYNENAQRYVVESVKRLVEEEEGK